MTSFITELLNKNKANFIVLFSYAIKAFQGLLVIYLLGLVLSDVQLNNVHRIYFLIGLASITDFGMPSVISRSLQRQFNKNEKGKLGGGLILMGALYLIGLIIITPIYLSFSKLNLLLPLIFLLILNRKIFNIVQSIKFASLEVTDFRFTELIFQFLRILFTISCILIFKSFISVLVVENILFIFFISLEITNKNLLKKISFKIEDTVYLKKQFSESWRNAFLYFTAYLSINLPYSIDLSNLDLKNQNNLFYNLKIFFSIKTLSQLPILNIQPKITATYLKNSIISFKTTMNYLFFSFFIYLAGITFFYLANYFDISFISLYFNEIIVISLSIIFLIDLFQAATANIIVATGNIPFYKSSVLILCIQFILLYTIEFDLIILLCIYSLRPAMLFFHVIYEANQGYFKKSI